MKKFFGVVLAATLALSSAPAVFAVPGPTGYAAPQQLEVDSDGYYHTVFDKIAVEADSGMTPTADMQSKGLKYYDAIVKYRVTFADNNSQRIMAAIWPLVKINPTEGTRGIYASNADIQDNAELSNVTGSTLFNEFGNQPANSNGTFYLRGGVTGFTWGHRNLKRDNFENLYSEFEIKLYNIVGKPGDKFEIQISPFENERGDVSRFRDRNGDVDPDILRPVFQTGLAESGAVYIPFSVEYDMNGGNGTAPTDNKQYTADDRDVTLAAKGSNFSITDGVFAGWTYEEPTTSGRIYKKGDTDIPTILLPGDTWTVDNLDTYLNDDGVVKLYAVWAEDTIGTGENPEDPDDIPDIFQVKVTFKAEVGTWRENGAAEYVKVYNKYDADNKYSATGNATIKNMPIAANITVSTGYQKPGKWAGETPRNNLVITEDKTYTYAFTKSDEYTYKQDTVDGPTITPTGNPGTTIGGNVTGTTPNTPNGETDNFIIVDIVAPDNTKPWDKVVICELDNIGGGDNGDEPDDIPDKYQVVVSYVSEDDAKGTVTGKKVEVFSAAVTNTDAEGRKTYAPTVNVSTTGSTAQGVTGWALDTWKNSKNSNKDDDGKFNFGAIDHTVEANRKITITALFAEDNIGGGDDGGDPDDIPDKYQVQVKFTVNDGKWQNGKKTIVKTYLLTEDGTDTGKRSETGKNSIKAADIPDTSTVTAAAGFVVNNKAAWNTNPGTPTAGTELKKANNGTEYVYDLDSALRYTYKDGETGDTIEPTDAPDGEPDINTPVHTPDGTQYFVRDVNPNPNDEYDMIVTCYPDRIGGGDDGGDPDDIPDYIQVKAQFDVTNGTWSDGTDDTITKYYTLTSDGSDGSDPDQWDENGFASFDPPDGMIHAENYKETGYWVDPAPTGTLTMDDKGANDEGVQYEYTFDPSDFSFGDEGGNAIDILKIPRWEGKTGDVTKEVSKVANISDKNITLLVDGKPVNDAGYLDKLLAEVSYEAFKISTKTFEPLTNAKLEVKRNSSNTGVFVNVKALDTGVYKIKLGDKCEIIVVVPGNVDLNSQMDANDYIAIYNLLGNGERNAYDVTVNSTNYDLWMLMADMTDDVLTGELYKNIDANDYIVIYNMLGGGF